MDVVEITTKTALVKSRIPGVTYAINPYLGCGHGCAYCYATFMRKYSRAHANSRWGEFVEVKTNIVPVLRAELGRRRATGRAMLSSVCDPYQPAEARHQLTRGCLEALKEFGWGLDILTRSPLVLRDVDLLATALDVSVGLSIPTDDDRVRQVLEPKAQPIASRVETLRQLHAAGIKTWVFIAPILPLNPERLSALVAPYAGHVLLDPLNYRGQVAALFTRLGWAEALTEDYAARTMAELLRRLGPKAALA